MMSSIANQPQDQFSDNHAEFTGSEHKAELSHELIAGAASYEAAKAYEKHVAENGTHCASPVYFSHHDC